jgi:hypothetical protein
VSLRSAELTKKENQDKRFIFHPDNQTGPFFYAVNNKNSSQEQVASASLRVLHITNRQVGSTAVYTASSFTTTRTNNHCFPVREHK